VPRFNELADRQHDRLAALGAYLKPHGFVTELGAKGLVVRHPQHRDVADTITCRPREDDGGRLWFFTSWQEPLAEADRLFDVVTQIKGYLVKRQ
jgi:hypothetical protein